MSQITNYLETLKLSDIESKLYLTLLESGPVTVRELAETIDMKRTTAYLYIDQLINKGLVIKIIKGSHKLIGVQDPETGLSTLVEQKLQDAKALRNDFPTILQGIHEILPQKKEVGEAEVKYVKGKNGVSSIYEEALSSKEVRTYVNIGDIGAYFPENLHIFDNAFTKNKDLKLHEIVEDSPASRKLMETLTKNDRYMFKFLPKQIRISASDIMIYDGNVAIINVRGNATGVVFNDRDYYQLSKELFDHLWRTLPKE